MNTNITSCNTTFNGVKGAENELYSVMNINEFKRLNSIQELVFELAREK